MATSTIALLQTIQTEEEKSEEISVDATRSCICGSHLIEVTSPLATEDECSICCIKLEVMSKKWQCHSNQHDEDWFICCGCIENTNKFSWTEIKNIHKPKGLYFIYDDKINGPYMCDEIISLYIKNRIKKHKIWIKTAEKEDSKWYEMHFPDETFNKLSKSDTDRPQKITEYIAKNDDIRDYFPEIYNNLITNILIGRIKKCTVELPINIPQIELKSSLFSLFIQRLGKILFFMMQLILSLHCIVTLFVSVCVTYFIDRICNDKRQKLNILFLILSYFGMAISPILIVYFILFETHYRDEIQSWMIAYISWGIMSFTVTTIYFITLVLKISNKTLNSLVFIIIGVELGEFDKDFNIIDFGFLAMIIMSIYEGFCYFCKNEFGDVMKSYLKEKDSVASIGRFYIFPSLACLLPAAITGFIANYVLEEKYELNCGANVSDEFGLCFDDQHGIGCCEIVSSHDYKYSYTFIGGLASNIVAIWAIIRVVGYLIVNASSSLSIYVTRKR